MKKRNLVFCSSCELDGKRNVLGEIADDGNFLVMRFHAGFTKVTSRRFAISCGECGEVAYIRREKEGELIQQ